MMKNKKETVGFWAYCFLFDRNKKIFIKDYLKIG